MIPISLLVSFTNEYTGATSANLLNIVLTAFLLIPFLSIAFVWSMRRLKHRRIAKRRGLRSRDVPNDEWTKGVNWSELRDTWVPQSGVLDHSREKMIQDYNSWMH